MERALIEYRAEPSDRGFDRVYRAAEPWLRRTAKSIVRGYYQLGEAAEDDLVVEGALVISSAARRYVFLCEDCGRAFLHDSARAAHARAAHARRGLVSVGLRRFVETSARLTMRRTAQRLICDGEVLVEDPRAVEVHAVDAEERVVFETLVQQVARRMVARERESLRAILSSSYDASDVERVRSAVVSFEDRTRRRML